MAAHLSTTSPRAEQDHCQTQVEHQAGVGYLPRLVVRLRTQVELAQRPVAHRLEELASAVDPAAMAVTGAMAVSVA
jgi:hypothetical protein